VTQMIDINKATFVADDTPRDMFQFFVAELE
jgi:hypothetical protein